MKLSGGYLQFEIPNFVPVRIHWTVIVLALIVGNFGFRPGAWLAAVLIILVHELGHAQAVAWARANVTAVYVDGMGGRCEWFGEVTRGRRLAIASAGVLAQLLLWVIEFSAGLLTGPPRSFFAADFHYTLLWWNLVVAVLNLLPISPLDGHTIWRLLPGIVRNWRRERRMKRRQRLTAITLKRMKEFEHLEVPATTSSEAKEAIRRAIEQAVADFEANQGKAKGKDD